MPYLIRNYLSQQQYQLSADDFTLFAFQRQAELEHLLSHTGQAAKSRKLYFLVRSALKNVGDTAQKCEALALSWTGNKDLSAKVELIIDEFLNNVIKHGYQYRYDAVIVLEFAFRNNNLLIRFWDKGIEWIPECLEIQVDSFKDLGIESFPTEGLGMNLIRLMVHKFSRRRYEGINETVLEIQLGEN
jgi:anti-sigma regulatory factor (Ser/Thr protein kinase)